MLDVVIVGLGPVGAVTAHLLSMYGLKVLAVDRDAEMFNKPRAIAADQETMRTVQRIGCADELEPMLGYYPPSVFVAADGTFLRQISPASPPYALSWPSYGSFVQPELDAMLRRRLADRKDVEIRLDAEVVSISQDEDGVDVTFKNGDKVRARYIIGSDGGASTIRRLMEAPVEDMAFDEPWIVVDCLLKREDEEFLASIPKTNVQYCDPARPRSFINGPRKLRRWEFAIHPGEDLMEMAKEENVWKLMDPVFKKGDVDIWRIAPYRFHAVVVEKWRFGRVFLAGDAAHQTPPFMGQGLNQGVRDAVNLAWKLAYVIQGKASESLLDSYEEERRPNVRDVIAITKDLGRVICERDLEKCAERNAKLKAEVAAGRGYIVRQDLLPPLKTGYLYPSPGAGVPGPQAFIEGHRRMDDVLGSSRFHLLLKERIEVPKSAVDPVVAVLHELKEEGDVLSAWFDKYGAVAALIRPDGSVFGTAKEVGEISALLEAADAGLKKN